MDIFPISTGTEYGFSGIGGSVITAGMCEPVASAN